MKVPVDMDAAIRDAASVAPERPRESLAADLAVDMHAACAANAILRPGAAARPCTAAAVPVKLTARRLTAFPTEAQPPFAASAILKVGEVALRPAATPFPDRLTISPVAADPLVQAAACAVIVARRAGVPRACDARLVRAFMATLPDIPVQP